VLVRSLCQTNHVEERKNVILDIELPVNVQQRLVQHHQQLHRVKSVLISFRGRSLPRIRGTLGDDPGRIVRDVTEIPRDPGVPKPVWASLVHDVRLLGLLRKIMPGHRLDHVPCVLHPDVSDLEDRNPE